MTRRKRTHPPERDNSRRLCFAAAAELDAPPDLWNLSPRSVRRSRTWARRLGAAALAVVATLAAAAGFLYWQANSIIDEFQAGDKKQVVVRALPELGRAPKRPAPGITQAVNILAIGSDRRAGETNGRSDTILLVRVDPDGPHVSVLSLPRDLRVSIPGHGENKINAAYSYGGAPLLITTVREYLGVPINHFVEVDFAGFGKFVNDIGGVYLPVDQRYYHHNDGSSANNWASIDLQPGYQKLDAHDALSFVRFRHHDTDFHRAARQQLFLREVGRQLQARLTDVLDLPSLLRTMAKATTSDLDSVRETLKLANTLRRVPPDRIQRVTLTGNGVMIGGVYFLQVSDTAKQEALRTWARAITPPADTHNARRRRSRGRSRRQRRRPMGSDPGSLVANPAPAAIMPAVRGLRICTPTQLPAGYRWPGEHAGRSYRLAGRPAAALYATQSSGVSVLWMFTTWQDPPILKRPSETRSAGGRSYDLYFDSGRLRMVSWRLGATRAWVTNTLRNELSDADMLALARSCV